MFFFFGALSLNKYDFVRGVSHHVGVREFVVPVELVSEENYHLVIHSYRFELLAHDSVEEGKIRCEVLRVDRVRVLRGEIGQLIDENNNISFLSLLNYHFSMNASLFSSVSMGQKS